jgi:hypothetical protein
LSSLTFVDLFFHNMQGCHLAFKKAKSALFGLFWNSFLEIKWFGHLAFSWPFFNLEENSIFLGLFWLNFNKIYNILWYFKKKIWYILVNFLLKFGLYLAFFTIWEFGLFWNCLWPNLAFFIFGTWQPWEGGREREWRRYSNDVVLTKQNSNLFQFTPKNLNLLILQRATFI